MAKLKKTKSAYASGAPPCPVTMEGSKPARTKEEMVAEYNAFLILFAAFIEQNNGRVVVSYDAIEAVKKQKKVLQIAPGQTGLNVQFTTFQETPVTLPPVEESKFLDSSVAQEARDFLAKQREQNDSK